MNRQLRIPAYRLHKGTGYAVVTLSDRYSNRRRDVYLGDHGSAASRVRYTEVLAEWEQAGRVLEATPTEARAAAVAVQPSDTVTMVALEYWRFEKAAKAGPDGVLTKRLESVQTTLRLLRSMYGGLPAMEFGPLALQRVRESMVAQGWARSTVNDRVRVIQSAFRWAVSREMINADVHTALSCVRPLRRHEAGVREGRKVLPVSDHDVQAVLPHVSPQVASLIRLQRLTAARGGELFSMRPIDLDTSGRVWLYRPVEHKTEHLGHERTIYIGPAGQEEIQPYLAGRPVDGFLFDPREAGGKAGARATHAKYDACSYRRAIKRACERAGVPDWHPHQLRHTAATALRKEFGIEAARLMLGHRSGSTTLIYAEADHGKALEIADQVG